MKADSFLFFLLLMVLFYSKASAQCNSAESFITVWKTDNFSMLSADNEIVIPGFGSLYDIYWEDVNDVNISGYSQGNDITKITFPRAGTYRVCIGGDFHRIRFDSGPIFLYLPLGDTSKIVNLEQWGSVKWSSMEQAFGGCSKLAYSATDIPDLSRVKSMRAMFSGCEIFNGNIGDWNTHGVENMNAIFIRAFAFNQDIGGWNTDSVKSISHIFFDATSFNQDVNNWNVSNVTDMSFAFGRAASFNMPLDKWKVDKVPNMWGLFSGASSFNQDLSSWNTSMVTNMQQMFEGASKFNQDISAWNTSKVTNMKEMFRRAKAFNKDISNWDVSNVSNMSYMLDSALVFNQPLNDWNTNRLANTRGMFSDTEEFNQPLDNWSTTRVVDMSYMFRGARKFNQDIGNWNTSGAIQLQYMFRDAIAFNQDISNWSTFRCRNMENMFRGAVLFNQDIGNWNTASVRSMAFMFTDAKAFDHSLGNWNLNSIEIVSGNMFNANLRSMLDGSGMSCENYDLTLVGWAGNPATKQNLELGSQGMVYWQSEEARKYLTTNLQWRINGDIFQEECKPPCTHPDLEPMLVLYEALSGASWLNNTGWKEGMEGSNCNPCVGWFGVSCENNRVSNITLINNRLKGEIPASIKNIRFLKTLRLESNEISGQIPFEVTELSQLRRISLHLNRITGSIPPQIANLQFLEWLELQNNQLEGEIPAELGGLFSLQLLYLHDNFLTGKIPGELGELSNLSVLLLQNNMLSGCLDENLLKLCPQLSSPWVNISGNTELANQNWFSFCGLQEGMCSSAVNTKSVYSKIKVYPNPATDYLYIQTNHIVPVSRIDILDYSGRCIKGVFDQDSIMISDLMPGFYLVYIYIEGSVVTKKFVKY
jgi:surface protein